MRHLSGIVVFLALLAGLNACAVKQDAAGSADRDVITAQDIDQVEARTAYEAIRRLRPDWLRRGRTRTPSPTGDPTGASRGLPQVYVDGVRVGGVPELRQIYAHEVAEVRYMSGPEATTRYGTGHEAGAILVTTVSR